MQGVLKLGLASLALSFAQIASAQSLPTLLSISPTNPVVNLATTESAEFAPDIATITFGVESRNRDRLVAMKENRVAMEKLLAALKRAGIADADITSSWFSVRKDYDFSGESRRANGYIASNGYVVTIRKLDDAEELIASAATAGANNIGNPYFDVKDRSPFLESLTRAATESARKRAEFHARLNGFSGVKLVSVSDGVDNEVRYMAAAAAVDAAASLDEERTPPPFRPQPVKISVQLSFAFEMVK
jgi:uncharacterized protein YggE